MMRAAGTLLTFVSAIVFPWPLTAFLTLGMALYEPLLPLATGLFADTLYYTPQGGALPLYTIFGAVATIVAFFVRSRLKAGSIGG